MPQRSSADGHLIKHAIAGFAGGLVGSWAMERFQQGLGWISEHVGGAPGAGGQQYRKPESEPATYQAADAIAETVTGEDVPEDYKPAAGALVHYAFGGSVGAVYGAAAADMPDVTTGAGLPFGIAVWLLADEVAIPLAGLSGKPTEYPLSDHATAFASHLIYGAATEAVRRLIVRAWCRRENDAGVQGLRDTMQA